MSVRSSSILSRLATLGAGCFIAAAGLLGTAHFVHAAALTSLDVQPASLVAGAVGNVTIEFTTDATGALANNDKIVIEMPTNFVINSGGSTAVTVGGTYNGTAYTGIVVGGQVITLTGNGAGTGITGLQHVALTLSFIKNPTFAGTTSTYTVRTFTNGGTPIDGSDNDVTADTIIAGTLTATNVQPTSLVVGASGTVTVSFTTVNSMAADDKIVITFGAPFNVSGAAVAGCSSFTGGTLGSSVVGQVVTIIRTGVDVSAPGAYSCTISGILNSYAGTTGTYTISLTTTTGEVRDTDAAVAADTLTAAALTSTNVAPGSLRAGTTNTATITFTTTNSIPSTGLIKVTFPSGFTVSSASGATCSSSMTGSFATGVSGQVVTITRSGGGSEGAGAETCTIGNIQNSNISGSTGTYTISTAVSTGGIIDTDAAVTADSVTPASSTESPTVTLTYGILVSAPLATTAYEAGDEIAISWSTITSTGTVAAVNLDYSTDGGITYAAIASNTANDGSYTWTAPSMSAQSVTIRVQATDLVTILATDTSDAFSIGSTTSDTTAEDTDTSAESTTLLPTGTFMKGESWTTVYYVEGATRRPFLDAQTFFTYADNFDAVIDTSDAYLANYTIGTPMMPKAGTVLVKVVSVNKVYALEADNTLRWITSEAIATSLYGSHWADYVIDVPVTAWGHFTIGDDVSSSSDIEADTSNMETRDALNSK